MKKAIINTCHWCRVEIEENIESCPKCAMYLKDYTPVKYMSVKYIITKGLFIASAEALIVLLFCKWIQFPVLDRILYLDFENIRYYSIIDLLISLFKIYPMVFNPEPGNMLLFSIGFIFNINFKLVYIIYSLIILLFTALSVILIISLIKIIIRIIKNDVFNDFFKLLRKSFWLYWITYTTPFIISMIIYYITNNYYISFNYILYIIATIIMILNIGFLRNLLYKELNKKYNVERIKKTILYKEKKYRHCGWGPYATRKNDGDVGTGWNMRNGLILRCNSCGGILECDTTGNIKCECEKLFIDFDAGRVSSTLGDAYIEVYELIEEQNLNG